MKFKQTAPHIGRADGYTWQEAERRDLMARILRLRPDQIGALTDLVGIRFHKGHIQDVVDEIIKHGEESVHLSILITEADTKENLLWWVTYFERHNPQMERSEKHSMAYRKNSESEKPLVVRAETWGFIVDRAYAIPRSELRRLLQNIGYASVPDKNHEVLLDVIATHPFLFLLAEGILDHPELLRHTTITLADREEYLIDKDSAKALHEGMLMIPLVHLADRRAILAPRALVIQALRNGEGVDQLAIGNPS